MARSRSEATGATRLRDTTSLRRLAVWGYTTMIAAWFVGMLAAAVALDRVRDSRPALLWSALTYRVAGLVCHQDPARSFRLAAWPLPVCARCTGLYLGGVIGALAAACATGVASRRFGPGRRGAITLSVVRTALAGAALPTALLWTAEWLAAAPVPNAVRALGAVPLGAVVSWVLVIVLAGVPLTDTPASSGVH